MFTFTLSRRWLLAICLSSCALAAGAAPAVHAAEVVSATPEGSIFAASPLGVSEDGRYVLMGNRSDGGEGQWRKDRDTGALVQVAGPSAVSGASFAEFSMDGQRVLYLGTAADGQRVLAVVDVEDGDTWIAARTAAANQLEGELFDNGEGVIYQITDATGQHRIFRATHTSQGGTSQDLLATDRELLSATEDGQTYIWKRQLLPATRPRAWMTGAPRQFVGTAVGWTRIGGQSRVVASTVFDERLGQPYPHCITSPQPIQQTDVHDLQIDQAGDHLWLFTSFTDSAWPSQGTSSSWHARATADPVGWEAGFSPAGVFQTTRTGSTRLTGLASNGDYAGFVSQSSVWSHGGTASWSRKPASAALPLLTGGPSFVYVDSGAAAPHGLMFAAGRGVVGTTGGPRGEASDGTIYAWDPAEPAPSFTPAPAPTAASGDLVDTPGLVTPVKAWANCDPPASGTVASAAEYVDLAVLGRNARTDRSAGTVSFKPWDVPSGARPAETMRITVSTFGIPTWSRTVPLINPSTTNLPRPYWLLPQSVTVAVGVRTSASAPLQYQRMRARWQAWR